MSDIVSATGLTFQLLSGRPSGEQGDAAEEERLALRAEIYGEPGLYGKAGAHGEPGFSREEADEQAREQARRFRVWRRQPGFALAAARHGEYLVGYACGMPLRPSTSWWSELTAPLPEPVTAEHPGRTFALTDLAVRASWRRQGIAGSLCRLLMDGRIEERATATVSPDATAAQRAFRNWGWRKVARTRGPASDMPTLDVLLVPLASRLPDRQAQAATGRKMPTAQQENRQRPNDKPNDQPRLT